MNIKIAGQSSKSHYQNTGSCGAAVTYSEHDLKDLSNVFKKLGVEPEDMAWFDMDGQVVSGAEVMDKIGRLTAHLGKADAKFYVTMIDPSDDELSAIGDSIKEQIAGGQPYVFDVMDIYAENFHREEIKDRHDLVAFAIAHIYKHKSKQQVHWHVIQARLSRAFQVMTEDGRIRTKHYKLSPLTNHRNTSKGVVRGGFDRVDFDAKCESRFDLRYDYKRRVENSFKYLLAEKKGTPEEKAVQETRLALQNFPELKKSIQTAITRRVERLANEAAERAKKERQAQEEAARQRAEAETKAAAEKAAEEARIATEKAAQEAVRREQNDIVAGYNSAVLPVGKRLYGLKKSAYELYKETKDSGIGVNAATASVYEQLVDTWKQNDEFNRRIKEEKTYIGKVEAVCGILTCLNPIVGLTAMLLASLVGDIHRASLMAQKKKLLAKVNSLLSELTALEAEKAALTIKKQDCLQQYLDAKQMLQEYRDSLQTSGNEVAAIKNELRAAEERDAIRRYVESDQAKGLLKLVNDGFDETHYSLVPGPLVETEKGMRWKLYTDGDRNPKGHNIVLYHQHDPAPQEHGESYIDFSIDKKGHLVAAIECDPMDRHAYGISGKVNFGTGERSIAIRHFRGTADENRARKQKQKEMLDRFTDPKKKQGTSTKVKKKN